MDKVLGMSEDGVTEQLYLIERGVRPMSLVASFTGDGDLPLKVATKLEMISMGSTVIPFVISRDYNIYDCGFASEKWVVETFKWTREVNEPMRSRVLGLLLGYSTTAIRDFEDRQSVRWFT